MGENMTDLTKITAPFGLLDKETQKALKAHGGPWEMYSGLEGWTENRDPIWACRIVYRAKPQPLTKPSVDWSHVAPQYKWLARDESGEVWMYSAKPNCREGFWDGRKARLTDVFASFNPGTCDWRDSLVERPE